MFRSKVCPIILDVMSSDIHVQVRSSPIRSNRIKSKVHWTVDPIPVLGLYTWRLELLYDMNRKGNGT